jgi:hypothetical protein
MKRIAFILALALAGCGESKKPPLASTAPKPPVAAPKEPEIKSDPNGKYRCIACSIKTNETACPKCKTVLKAAEAPAAPKSTAAVGKSAVSAVFACPEAGCSFTDARKGTCLKHSTVQLKEQWFVCEKCSKKEPVAGKCAGCGAELVRKLQ